VVSDSSVLASSSPSPALSRVAVAVGAGSGPMSVPEPGTMALLAVGLVLATAVGRSRRHWKILGGVEGFVGTSPRLCESDQDN